MLKLLSNVPTINDLLNNELLLRDEIDKAIDYIGFPMIVLKTYYKHQIGFILTYIEMK